MTPERHSTDPSRAGPAASNPAETAYSHPDTAGGVPRPAGGSPQDWVGQPLGKYTITGVLGQGGMGTVLKARDPLIERDVAIKVLADHLSADESALGRFLAEAKSAGKVSHANVVAIYEIGQTGDSYYLVLEYVAGGSLADRLEGDRPLSVLEATQALIDACQGVGAAHAAGLIHRDIKPANFMRATDGTIKVADFGLAKAGDAGKHLTRTGTVVGTPYYMSPEQCEARQLDHRTDLYSLGATYYCLLTGKHPYQDSDSVPQLMYQHCRGPIPDPRTLNRTVPEACSHIIARAMAKAPADRYQSAADMLADLQAVAATLTGRTQIVLPSSSGAIPVARHSAPRRTSWIVAGLVFVAVVGLGLFAWRPWQKAVDAGVPVVLAGEPVKVGVLHSLTGTMAGGEAPVVDAVRFAIEEVNQAGGVLGRPVKAVIADGRSDSETFAREAERLISSEQVNVVFGCWTSASRKTVKPIFEKHDHLLVYPVQFEGLESSPNIAYLGAAPNQQILPAIDWVLKELGKKRFFLIGSDYVFPRAAHAIVTDALKKAGTPPVGEAFVPLGSHKVEAAIAEIVRTKPDIILNSINGDSNVTFFRALREAGIKPATTPTLSFSVSEQSLRNLNPNDLLGDYAAWTYFETVATPENETFVRQFHEKFPADAITDPMETAYVGVKMWAAAANDAQTLDPKRVRRVLLDQRLKGPGGDVRLDPDTQYCYRTPRIAQIRADGRFHVIWTAPAPVKPDPYPASRTAEVWRAFLHDLHTGWGNRWAAPDR